MRRGLENVSWRMSAACAGATRMPAGAWTSMRDLVRWHGECELAHALWPTERGLEPTMRAGACAVTWRTGAGADNAVIYRPHFLQNIELGGVS
jgi:hypothetical protein